MFVAEKQIQTRHFLRVENLPKLSGFSDSFMLFLIAHDAIEKCEKKDVCFFCYQEYQKAQLDVAQCFFLQFFVRQVRWSVTPIDLMSN